MSLICRPVHFSQFLLVESNTVNEQQYMIYLWAHLILLVLEMMGQEVNILKLWLFDAYCQVAIQKCYILYLPKNGLWEYLAFSWWLLTWSLLLLLFSLLFLLEQFWKFCIKSLHPTDKLLMVHICHFLKGIVEGPLCLCSLYRAKWNPIYY